MKKSIKALLISVCALPCVLFATASPGAAAKPTTTHPCPTYYVCVYSGTTTSSSITYKWESYGAHNIYGQNGDHLVVNAQSGGAYASAYSAYNGKGTDLWTLQDGRAGAPPRSGVHNLGPVYSFKLSPGPACWPRCV